ncbi:PilZ domain-containing protein [Methylobacterium dankookense]|uniref:PilZ domain-containing protein n=1 Tax=Methylobacterium dankookense TaxID=560405 RepID=A0A564G5W6_9HYPH|nr:PilZ domain-containing protein [Methylobacterium dankookense]GJD59242.1 hypothetical protein IFDJLNFL_5169 [Methylobacterium dankookense]VUF15338.1 hypothetical protein MTDSW087_05076 [Methylobacterium dankookense]
MSAEHRQEVRQRVFLKGRIRFNNGASSMDCLVRDLSATGARISLSETATLPEVFDLYIPQKDRTYRATLRWRREDGVGVTFEDAAKPASPAAAEPAADVSALLRRIAELEAENTALRRLLTGMAQSAPAA